MARTAFCLWLMLAVWPAAARDLDGVTIPDTLAVVGETKPLALNGAGYRKKFMLKVYIGALYTGAPLRTTDTVLQHGGPRVMRLHFLRAVGADKMAQGWNEAFAANHTPDQQQALSGRMNELNTMMPDVKTGDVLRMELLAGGKTRVLFNDTLRGSIDGADFQQALLRLWLGEKPADDGMKQALLGGGR
jgi:long-chain acyl-CoA synthetase